MHIKKSGSFYVGECLAVVTYPSAPETAKRNDRKVTFTSVADATKVWHRRIGYLSTKAIVAMSKKEVVLGIPKLEGVKFTSLIAKLFDPVEGIAQTPAKGFT
jgi:hypothetical protein